ncbi:hypothetical protein [Solirubrobacter soli]|uniref:hypothetical protein n=1 Tax=Solirubrobacter soli TaxID=363832 RepID=UPI000404AFE7|nr:hypothetical protein [Solirubrobacter soli]
MRFYTALLVTAAMLLVGVAKAHAAPLVGIGEQSPEMFSDADYAALDVHHARYVAPWDALHDPWETTKLDSYLLDAKTQGTHVLLSFGRSNRHTRTLPSARTLAHEFKRFRARYPWVTDYVTWNEANHCSQPTCRRPDRVAQYYVALKRACLRCRIVAADLLDDSRIATWASAFLDTAGRDRKLIWGLHNYIDANRFRTRGTKALLKATKGEVWFTETGGIVKRKQDAQVPLPASREHAARAARWVFRLAELSPRIKRIYFYHWTPPTDPLATWDSALTNANGTPRPAYSVVRNWLRRERARH